LHQMLEVLHRGVGGGWLGWAGVTSVLKAELCGPGESLGRKRSVPEVRGLGGAGLLGLYVLQLCRPTHHLSGILPGHIPDGLLAHGSQINAVKDYCQSHSAQLIGCVGNYTKSYPIRSPIDSLYCCDRAEDSHCQVACRRILRTMSTEHEIMEGLIEECGSQPLPQDPLWQCFLGSAQPPTKPEEPLPPAKMDRAKLHCCAKANTSLCREMCQKVSTNWGSQTWQEFDKLCEYNHVETELISCLADVREACQLGCKDLAYCTNFNNRPTELFRSCSVQSDQGAMNDIKLWSNGTIKMPFMNIPVLDIRKCQPEMWKAVACALQIKPCHSKSRGSVICKSDCVDILTQCGDQKRFHEGQTPERICDLLSPVDDPDRCIPLHRYLSDAIEEVIHPCNPNPCPSNHLCQVNRKGCHDDFNCLPYFCVPGCKLGDASDFLVQMDTRIQVPTLSGPAGCYEVCMCGVSGRLEDCRDMPCVDTSRSCVVGGHKKNHGTSFSVDCNTCSCFAGETICSTRQCYSLDDEDIQRFTGTSHVRLTPCVCVSRCVPKRRVCLSDASDDTCHQFECVGRPAICDINQLDPVCDTDGVVHANLCQLHQSGKTLAYLGQCQDACRKWQPVCGQNGETYSTVCEAFSDRVAVDYEGSCRAVGAMSDYAVDSGCDLVLCPPPSNPSCVPVTPPGACCPICASILQVLWNQDQMNVFAKVEACSKEAEKIDSLINSGSPTLISHVPLSAFLTSELRVPSLCAFSRTSTPPTTPINPTTPTTPPPPTPPTPTTPPTPHHLQHLQHPITPSPPTPPSTPSTPPPPPPHHLQHLQHPHHPQHPTTSNTPPPPSPPTPHHPTTPDTPYTPTTSNTPITPITSNTPSPPQPHHSRHPHHVTTTTTSTTSPPPLPHHPHHLHHPHHPQHPTTSPPSPPPTPHHLHYPTTPAIPTTSPPPPPPLRHHLHYPTTPTTSITPPPPTPHHLTTLTTSNTPTTPGQTTLNF
ncbi:hypothetical protein CRUP_030084, partial [Coryphaenoides rupestris]